mgnify:FL=1
MPTPARVLLTILVWVAVAAGWFAITASQHPTLPLALGVTITLVLAFAIAAHLNLALRTRRRRLGTSRKAPWLVLIPAMLVLTGLALAIIRTLYTRAGYTPGPIAQHFAIDLFGMAVHVAAVAGIARLFQSRPAAPTPADSA